jgi:putative flavoprotein involved in K+ transport
VSSNGDPERLEVAVVGAGQAGLAIGYFLARQGCRFAIFDRADAVGAAWRDRWDSLVLFTPRRYDSLPGMRFQGEPNGYPTRDEVIAYLESYATTFELQVELGRTVRSLTKGGEAFVLTVDGRSVEADQVVVATGPFQTQRVPAWANELAPEVVQIDSASYRARVPTTRGRRCSQNGQRAVSTASFESPLAGSNR